MTARRGRWAAALLLCGAAAGIGAAGGSADAAPLVSFKAIASADGVRQVVTRPDAPLSSQVVDSGIPSAQAAVDGLGNSEAYGSFVYPGETVLSGPGLISGVIGQSLPGYPVIAASSDPNKPEDDESKGPVVLKATSTPTSSTGTSSFEAPGAGVGRLVATAKVTSKPAEGSLTALATGEATAIDVAGVLRMSSVRSEASAALADGKVKATSSLEMGEASVAGVRVVLTKRGVELPGQTIPLPDTSPVLGPLKDAGVTVEYVAEQKLPNGIRSAGVRVTTTQATPDGGSATVSYAFGQSMALVSATSDPSAGVSTPVFPAAPVTPGVAQAPVTSAAAPPTGAVEAPAPALAPAPEAAPAAAPPLAAVATAADLPFARMDSLSFYLVLVLAGAAALAAQKALRRYGVSSTWTS